MYGVAGSMAGLPQTFTHKVIYHLMITDAVKLNLPFLQLYRANGKTTKVSRRSS